MTVLNNLVGKWHVGEQRPHWPLDRGFERYFGLISGGSNYRQLDSGRVMAMNDSPFTPQGDGFYMTDAFADHAMKFIDDQRGSDKPFFLYLAFTAPHWPLHAWPEDIARYESRYSAGWDVLRAQRHRRMIDLGIVEAHWALTPRDPKAPAGEDIEDKAAECRKMAVYAAPIDRMDRGIGRILASLRDIGAAQNTLVMFLSDNGGCAEEINRGTPGVPPGPKESFRSYGLPWANAGNTPFRRYKHWVHEGGITTSLIVHWSAVIRKGGSLTHQVGHIIDLMATCVDVAGARYPQQYKDRRILPMEGKSLLPIFEGRTRQPHEALFWEHERNRAVRQGKWKLVAVAKRPLELYDLEADRTELKDLAAAEPERVRQMADLYERWAEQCNVTLPPTDSGPSAATKRSPDKN